MTVSILLLITILFCCCYIPAFLCFHEHPGSVTFFEFWLYVGLGMASLGVLGICCLYIGLDTHFSVLPGFFLTVYTLKKFGLRFIPQIHFAKLKTSMILFPILGSIIFFLYIFIPGILMGVGKYPPVFFNIDSSFYLEQIQSFIRHHRVPPPSLSFMGGEIGYHYGSQIVCFVLSVLTKIPPHTISFLIFAPIIQLSTLCTVWLIVLSLVNSKNRFHYWWGVPFILFSTFFPVKDLLHAIYMLSPELIIKVLSDPQCFRGGYPMLSSHYGVFSSFTCIYGLQHFSGASYRRIITYIVGIVIIFKSPFFVVLGAGYGLWILYEIKKTKNISLLWSPLLSLILAICLFYMGKPASTHRIVFSPWQFIHSQKIIWDTLGLFILYAIPIFLVMWTTNTSYRNEKAWQFFLYFCLPGLVFVNVFGLVKDGSYDGNIYQLLLIYPIFVSIFTFTYFMDNWQILKESLRKSIVIFLLTLIILPFGHRLIQTSVLLYAPELGHEYVDNKSLAEALAYVPIDSTVTVTNDFRYPAKNYKHRDLLQVQMAALYGHQMYATNFRYGSFPEAEKRLSEQRKFRNKIWDAELEILAQREGWTHLVIHRASPHAENIPIVRIFSNSNYSVYRF